MLWQGGLSSIVVRKGAALDPISLQRKSYKILKPVIDLATENVVSLPFEDAIELSCNCEITPSHEP